MVDIIRKACGQPTIYMELKCSDAWHRLWDSPKPTKDPRRMASGKDETLCILGMKGVGGKTRFATRSACPWPEHTFRSMVI